MSLLIDDDHVTLSDLLAIDPEVGEIADAESILVEGDGSIIRQAWDECADTLLESMQAFGGDLLGWPGSLALYGGFGVTRPRVRLNQIVVSAPYGRRYSPLRRWMIYQALVLFYRAAMNRRTSDRYELKWERMTEEAKRYWRHLWTSGLPIVAVPLACPGALHEYQAGEWSQENVSTVPGGSAAQDDLYYVAVTWTAGDYVSPTVKNNGESGPSKLTAITVPAGNVLRVSIAGLNAPGTIPFAPGIADGPFITRQATGWNVYVGKTDSALYLQNATPIPLATTTYTLPDVPVLSGSMLQPGQVPDANFTFQRTLQRG